MFWTPEDQGAMSTPRTRVRVDTQNPNFRRTSIAQTALCVGGLMGRVTGALGWRGGARWGCFASCPPLGSGARGWHEYHE